MAATLKRRRTDLSTIHELHGETGAVVKLTGIRELWEREKFTDLVLQAKCDGTSDVAPIKVHRVVVAACSPTLEAMLCHDMRESVEGSITLQDIAPTALDELVRFMYTVRHLIFVIEYQCCCSMGEFV